MRESIFIASAKDIIENGHLTWRVVGVRGGPADEAFADLELQLVEDQATQGNPDWMTIETRVREFPLDWDTTEERQHLIAMTIELEPML